MFTERPSATLEALVLWVPMLPSDDAVTAAVQAGLWPGRRVEHWWDGAREMSELFRQSLGLREAAWDVYLLYAPGVRWDGEVPPAPSFWMHQLSDQGADPDYCLSRDPARLARELDRLLEEESMQMASTLTCPACGTQHTETMELNACRYLYTCSSCGQTLRPLPGECCVFCSYGDVPCPPQQTGNACCG